VWCGRGQDIRRAGADVIKIESKDNLDFMRTIGPDMNNSAQFNEANRNKEASA